MIAEQGIATSREKAKALISAGIVYVGGRKISKPGESFDEAVEIEIRGEALKYVSRGGLKLEKAIDEFGLELTGAVCMDIGASTGGFTDCMLQNGAVKVYAVDVGSDQLAASLRSDSRVINMEHTNARTLTEKEIPEKIDFFSVDVSFISLCLILPALHNLLADGGKAVCLIKPQFEAGKEKVGKKGVIKDKNVHRGVIEKIENFVLDNGFSILGLTFSPVKGPEGNIEYLIYLQRSEVPVKADGVPKAEVVVAASHAELDK